ncbi:site-specific integrase [Xanthocytophaga flava]|uniref:site-specific integrase n=1 Tax=Xanthocytophaga flava TaxID=3048013 RepID=UPI0028D10E4C|nr:phage integrase SAM-like domain-containing protein [Xanthocytophaga flavus]MDJ1468146.1 phage integrase SAM-like domain-containing protein [Xanthocytophaga flavus]
MITLFWLRKNQANRKGECPIWCSISMHQSKAEFSCKISVHPDQWDQRTGSAIGKNAEYINPHLELIEEKLLRIKRQLQSDEKEISPQIIKEMLLEKKAKAAIFSDLEKEHYTIKILRLKSNSVKNENSHRANLNNFLKETKQQNISAEEIDESFMDDFEAYLDYHVSKNHNYKIRHLRLVKQILKWAKKKKKIKDNPIENLAWVNGEDDATPILSSYDVHKIESTIFKNEALQQVADRFLIQVYTGFSYIDLVNFQPDMDIVENFIKKERQKTNVEAIIPVLDKLKALLAKYGGTPPHISNVNYNGHLKSLATICGIRINLTTRVARKTGGQLWLDSGLSIEAVSRILGHSNIRTTQKSYVKVTETRIEMEMKKNGLW